MSERPLCIAGSGMVTAVGLSAPAACAAIRCGITAFRETRFMDSRGEWIVGSEVRLEQPWHGAVKVARMLASVIEESFATDASIHPERTPIVICLAERERPGRPPELKQRVFDALSEDVELHPDSTVISQGRVGGVVALRQARGLIYDKQFPAVIIAGADTYLAGPTLAAYEERRRLSTSDNSNGFIPGEAAAAIVVKRPVPSDVPQLTVVGMGFAVESATVECDEPLRADGLVGAIRGALTEARAGMAGLDFRITDIAGEHYGFKEAALALARLLRARKEEFDMWHPADCLGEIGAAAGPAAFNVAWAAAQKGYAKGNNVLCHFGNDDGKRAAAVLTYQPVGGARG